MNDIRRTILWVIFGFSMVMLWDQWQVFNGHKATFFPTPGKPVATVPGAVAAGTPAVGTSPVNDVPITGGANANPAMPPVAGAAAVAIATPRERIVVGTDVMKLTFDSEGGSVIHSEFIQHSDMSDLEKGFVLLDDSAHRVYVAQSGVIASGINLPNHTTAMTAIPGDRTLKDGQNELSVRFESPVVGGVKLVKTYTLRRGAYDIHVKHEIINMGTVPVSPELYVQLVRDGNKPAGESSFYSTFTGPAVYTSEKKYQKIEFKDIKNQKADFEKTATDGYIAMVQHYFASAWILPAGLKRTLQMDAVDIGRPVADCCYRVATRTPLDSIAPGASKSIEAVLYIGPQEEHALEALSPGLELVKDYGWLTILAKPLYWLLDKLHGILGNWGWAIVALVVLLKIAFYWLNAHAYKSMAKMKAINPQVMAMRERLKDKPQEMQQEMMRIYREEKVNPMGGCFPILIQIPVFIALYWVLLSTVEMRHAPWVMWIHDLAAPDPYYILPLVMTGTTLLQTWLNPTPPDPVQAKLMWIMPLVFSIMFFMFPSGLVLYWLTNNILSIAQQWIINRQLGVLGK